MDDDAYVFTNRGKCLSDSAIEKFIYKYQKDKILDIRDFIQNEDYVKELINEKIEERNEKRGE